MVIPFETILLFRRHFYHITRKIFPISSEIFFFFKILPSSPLSVCFVTSLHVGSGRRSMASSIAPYVRFLASHSPLSRWKLIACARARASAGIEKRPPKSWILDRPCSNDEILAGELSAQKWGWDGLDGQIGRYMCFTCCARVHSGAMRLYFWYYLESYVESLDL